jgi:tetratricopeptide (TPR) repeat protein
MPRLAACLCTIAIAAGVASSPAAANPQSEALRARATHELYNLNRDRAAALYREAIAADPNDAAAHRGLASALWLNIAFSRGATTVDNYLGRISRYDVRLPPPPPGVAAEFRHAIDRALDLARKRIAANPKDADAHYQLGAAVGLRASYTATVEGSVRAAFGAAREAYNAHERVLELNPARRDAGLIVGTYRYVVAALALPLRLFAYAAGFGGGREKGLQLIEAASTYGGDNQADARLALVLLYNREGRYDEAVKQLTELMKQFPRNRLLWLESGSTSLRAGKAAEAERVLNDGIAGLASDDRPRMFGEEALWYYKRGAARAALGRASEAEQDLRKSVSSVGRNWVHGRARLELGKLALKAGNHDAARTELREALRLCEADNDKAFADEARKLIR